MKAIFGKLSILCFVTVVAYMLITRLWGELLALYIDPNVDFGIILFLPPVFVFFGFLFCVLSSNKKETPQYYRYIGFLLNLLLTVLYILLFHAVFYGNDTL